MNNKLLNMYDNWQEIAPKKRVSDYLEIVKAVLDYAEKHDIHTLKEIDEASIISDFFLNVIGDFELEIEKLDKKDYDLDVAIDYIDRLVRIVELDDNTYENCLRCKTNSFFKFGKPELGEKVMLDLIEEKHNSIYPYVELVDDYAMLGDLKKAKYYYDLGMKQTNLKELDVLEERSDYFDAN